MRLTKQRIIEAIKGKEAKVIRCTLNYGYMGDKVLIKSKTLGALVGSWKTYEEIKKVALESGYTRGERVGSKDEVTLFLDPFAQGGK